MVSPLTCSIFWHVAGVAVMVSAFSWCVIVVCCGGLLREMSCRFALHMRSLLLRRCIVYRKFAFPNLGSCISNSVRFFLCNLCVLLRLLCITSLLCHTPPPLIATEAVCYALLGVMLRYVAVVCCEKCNAGWCFICEVCSLGVMNSTSLLIPH